MSELDLEHGDAERAERIAESGAGTKRTRRVRREAGSTSDSAGGKPSGDSTSTRRGSKTSSARGESGLAERLRGAFDRLANQFETRGDQELSTALREEKEGMTQGLLSITRPLPMLRKPLVFFLGIGESILAFWRVGGILLRRLIEWRMNRLLAAQAMGEFQDQEQGPVETVPGTGL